MKTACSASLAVEAPIAAASAASAVARRRVARLLLPREHGSWALAFEPLVLGLLAAPSAAGAALALAVIAAFFARTPCKQVAADVRKRATLRLPNPERIHSMKCRASCGQAAADSAAFQTRPGHKGRPYIRQAGRVLAGRLLFLLATVAAAGIGVAAGLRGVSALWPLLPALPCGAVFLLFDLRNDARAGVAEVAGAAAFACVPGALAILAGWPASRAFGLTAVMLVRAVPTVLVIRACLRRRKGRPAAPGFALATAWGGVAVVLALVVSDVTGWLPLVLASALALRAVWLLGPWAPAWSARRLGIAEAVLGALYATTVGLGF